MRASIWVACVAGVLSASASLANVTRVHWVEVTSQGTPPPPDTRTFDLRAEVSPGTRIVTVDLGDSDINLPPDGQNTGLRLSGGQLIQSGTIFTSNDVRPSPARVTADPLLYWDTYAALGNLVESEIGLIRPIRATNGLITGTWFDVPHDEVIPGSSLNGCAPGANCVLLARITVNRSTTHLGGDPGAQPSRVFIYWELGTSNSGVVLNIPNAIVTCRADFNENGSVTVQDIFDFLPAYFSGDPRADINGVGGVSVQDIFDFLALYFIGCP